MREGDVIGLKGRTQMADFVDFRFPYRFAKLYFDEVLLPYRFENLYSAEIQFSYSYVTYTKIITL